MHQSKGRLMIINFGSSSAKSMNATMQAATFKNPTLMTQAVGLYWHSFSPHLVLSSRQWKSQFHCCAMLTGFTYLAWNWGLKEGCRLIRYPCHLLYHHQRWSQIVWSNWRTRAHCTDKPMLGKTAHCFWPRSKCRTPPSRLESCSRLKIMQAAAGWFHVMGNCRVFISSPIRNICSITQ